MSRIQLIKEKKFGIKNNVMKTIVIGQQCDDRKLEEADSFKYLGRIITWNGSCAEDNRCRTALGKSVQ